jgi:hypothetical protein
MSHKLPEDERASVDDTASGSELTPTTERSAAPGFGSAEAAPPFVSASCERSVWSDGPLIAEIMSAIEDVPEACRAPFCTTLLRIVEQERGHNRKIRARIRKDQ